MARKRAHHPAACSPGRQSQKPATSRATPVCKKPGARNTNADAARAGAQGHRIELVQSPEDRGDDHAQGIEMGNREYSWRQKPGRCQIRRDRDQSCASQKQPDDCASEVRAGQPEGWSVAHAASW